MTQHAHTEERERERDRQTDRQTETETETDRQTDRQTDRDRETERAQLTMAGACGMERPEQNPGFITVKNKAQRKGQQAGDWSIVERQRRSSERLAVGCGDLTSVSIGTTVQCVTV